MQGKGVPLFRGYDMKMFVYLRDNENICDLSLMLKLNFNVAIFKPTPCDSFATLVIPTGFFAGSIRTSDQ